MFTRINDLRKEEKQKRRFRERSCETSVWLLYTANTANRLRYRLACCVDGQIYRRYSFLLQLMFHTRRFQDDAVISNGKLNITQPTLSRVRA